VVLAVLTVRFAVLVAAFAGLVVPAVLVVLAELGLLELLADFTVREFSLCTFT
jgi:hypothetical protein